VFLGVGDGRSCRKTDRHSSWRITLDCGEWILKGEHLVHIKGLTQSIHVVYTNKEGVEVVGRE